MNIRIFSFPVFSFQFNVNNNDGVATNKRTPITIISIDKISESDLEKFNEFVPNRLKLFDEMNFNMHPI